MVKKPAAYRQGSDMTEAVLRLFAEANRLTLEEREALADLIFNAVQAETGGSLDDPSHVGDTDWSSELERRWDEHVASGKSDAVDAFDAIKDMRTSLAKFRSN
ncbi:MAG: hypothetical protein SH859_00905 [Hyphomicrobium aestuarii]|nr:hypothetical protein [Hyphomicrobium aestuarii]